MIRWKTVSITAVISMIPVGFAVNAAYVNYHIELAKDVVMPAIAEHTAQVEKRIDSALTTANETQHKVDELSTQISSLQVSAAIAAVAALQTELDRHERNPEDSESWRRERDRLRRQVEQAKEYRQCLIDQKTNCDLLRGW